MSVIIFIIILGALIFVHELGHFLVAKKNGIRVDEFAIGFPPTLISHTRGGTKYSLNLIPFGGYVKIFGENPDEESLDVNRTDSFVNKSRWIQAAVLVAGVVFNIVFAWALFVVILISGAPTSITAENTADATDTFVLISNVMENAPAAQAGLVANDIIISASNDTTTFSGETLTVEQVKEVITSAPDTVTLEIKRGDEVLKIETVPVTGIIGDTKALGISMDRIGTLSTPWYRAFSEAFTMTWSGLKAVFFGLGHLVGSLVTGSANLNSVSGPVGIVDMVGSAAKFGFVNLLAFTAMLSLNLAVLNIMPFPALDGGRLLFLAIESVIRRRIKPAFANATNALGFLILIGFMIVVTINDVLKLF